MGDLGFADEQGKPTAGTEQAGGRWQDGLEFFDGPQSDHVGCPKARWALCGCGLRFGPALCAASRFAEGLTRGDEALGEYIDVRQCKGANDFPKEGGFLLVGFDEGEVDERGPDLDGQSGESGAGTEISYTAWRRGCGRIWTDRVGEKVAGGEQGFSEVAGDDFLRPADGGEVDAGVPAEQYIDVCRYLFQLRLG